MKASLIALVLASFLCGIKGSRPMYGNCKIYDPDETKDSLEEGKGRYCEDRSKRVVEVNGEYKTVWGKKTYCLEYNCPPAECGNEEKVKDREKCDRCKGDCVWLGFIIKNGTGGNCEDGCNTCVCTNGSVSASTFAGCHLKFCF